MELLLLVGGALAFGLFVLIDRYDALLDAVFGSQNPLEQFDPDDHSFDSDGTLDADDAFDGLDEEDPVERLDDV